MRHYHIKKQLGWHAFETLAFFHGDDAAFQKRFCELSEKHGGDCVAEVSDHPFPESIPEGTAVEEAEVSTKPRRKGKLAS
jgi:hypothetical protein